MPDVKLLTLQVPKRHIAPLAVLLEATDAEFSAFEHELARTSPQGGIGALLSRVSAQAGWPKTQDVPALGGLLVSLFAMADGYPAMSIEEFTREIARAAEATGDEKLRASPDRWEVLRERLGRILGPTSPLWLSAKANLLRVEQERLFCDARILTDIRPIFGRKASTGPAALTIVHTLKLSYHHGSEELEELFVSLDDDDLQTLKQVIQRAEEKQGALEPLVQKTGIDLLPPKTV